ncbi:MAG TPA: 4Fe-4S double cluster binding domain-containing protein [Thermoclostridium caenicola]|uniref:4Fe-4S double cluster binding domain-containing protein n=1 Tax=Thermoclostridium caenicola TaxID=659425 RepID=UPI002CFBA0BA|nr:4Fe-4S double cluster binding domain-containing protein [Thermoclostridium caenicola]HOK43635.1 4Fe-4S double cluster binding domain-containing protein [Thermoclostridium caenicola]HOL83689.1 4Fe-4S double cluster binding domain-containing protein [Thermoclostridium caenicola]HPO75900.1 4Fe-4S double cluster binding domain-containing protein [Thermoclostridium caenicola]
MNHLSSGLRSNLLERGASLVGFADLKDFPAKDRIDFAYGVSIAVAIRPDIIRGIENGPTLAYYEEYVRLNEQLNSLAEYTADYLKGHGFEAIPQTTTRVVQDRNALRTPLPHKTVATRAGLGWIGKCALLVTKSFGSALRFTSVLTNAPLPAGIPVNASSCGTCTRCREACPGKAVKGINWSPELEREEYYDAHSCEKAARELMLRLGIDYTICGKCIYVCPWTQRYLDAHR